MDKTSKSWLIGIASIICLWIAIVSFVPSTLAPARVSAYNSEAICLNAFDQHLDFREFKGNHFSVPLQEHCFGGVVYTPKAWNHWETQLNGKWNAIWIVGNPKAYGPMGPNDRHSFMYNQARFQGSGNILFYTNDVVGTAEPTPGGEAGGKIKETEEPITIVDARGNYVQEKFCTSQDSPEGELHYETLQIEHFTVKMQEGCWSPYIYPPNNFDHGFHNVRLTASSVGREPDWWIAIWPLGKAPAGPFTRDDSSSSKYRLVIPNESKPFRVQGKGEVWIGNPNPFTK